DPRDHGGNCRPARDRRLMWFRIFAVLALLLSSAANGQVTDPIALANPFQGVDGGGNTVPGASVPFGFVSLSPDTLHGSTSGYDSGGLILGFSHTHVSGTGGGSKYGNFRVTPAIGEDAWGNLLFTESGETEGPGYCAVMVGAPG